LTSSEQIASSGRDEQVQDCHADGVPNGGLTTVAASTEQPRALDNTKRGAPKVGISDRRSASLSRTKPLPRMDLTHNIPLHSPTPMVGTPFDVKANYEYPFPRDYEHSSSVPAILIPNMTSRPPSAGSLHMLSGSPPPHMGISVSPPPVSASYTSSPAHPKMRSREPPVPPSLITKRRPNSKVRRESNDSIRGNSDATEDASPMGGGSIMSGSGRDLSEQPSIVLRERRKKDRDAIEEGSVDFGNVRIIEAEAVDATASVLREAERPNVGDASARAPSELSGQASGLT